MALHNWSRTLRYSAATVEQPTSLDELAAIVCDGGVRALGTRHSFCSIGDAPRLVSTSGLGERFEVAEDRRSVRIDGAMTYARLASLLAPEGLALANLASLPHISVAGAVATATHGSGLGNGNLATSVRGMTLVSPTGVHVIDAEDPMLAGAVVSLGALGVVTDLTLAVEPTFDVAQTVYHGVTWDELVADPVRFFGAAYSVSLFTRYGTTPGLLWLKRRVGRDGDDIPSATVVAVAADQHPIPGHPAESCTPQLGKPGSWSDRLPHFRADFTPSSGAEIQSEYFVPLASAGAAIDAVRRVGERLDDALLVAELRTVAGDDLWMSPQSDGPTLALHFTWIDDEAAATDAAAVVEHALLPYGPRRHWGKHVSGRVELVSEYANLPRFLELQSRLDPDGHFRNDWFDRTLRG